MIDTENPPENGELHFSIDIAPVSTQAPRAKKDLVTAAVRKEIGEPDFILSGEVKVGIEWLLHPSLKFESDSAPDVDNIAKVVLDALCGPRGVLINDCQVQELNCWWVDWNSAEQRVNVVINFIPDEWLSKSGLRFIAVKGPLCFPLAASIPTPNALIVIRRIEAVLEARAETNDWYAKHWLMPIQTLFHKSRLAGFSIVSAADIRASSSTDPR